MGGRIIDSDAINKRVFADIENTFQHSLNITGENTIQNFVGADDPNAAAVDNFNFNGIEMSKVKQMTNYIQTHKKTFYFDRQLVELTNDEQKSLAYFVGNPSDPEQKVDLLSEYGVNLNNCQRTFIAPRSFDGRNSFVVPSFVIAYYEPEYCTGTIELHSPGAWWGEKYYVSEKIQNHNTSLKYYKMSIYKATHAGLPSKKCVWGENLFMTSWGAPISNSNSQNEIIVDKAFDKITITSSIVLSHKNFAFRAFHNRSDKLFNSAALLEHNLIKAVYLDVFFMYWRDK